MNRWTRSAAGWAAILGLGLATMACQQSGNSSANGSAAGGAGNNKAGAAASSEFSALPSDASLPEVCQTYIREVQACLAKLTDPGKEEHAARLRDQATFLRREWGNYGPDATPKMCTRDLAAFQQYRKSGGMPC